MSLQRRCATQKAGVQPRQQLVPHSRTLVCSHTAIHSPSLPFKGLHSNNPCNYMNYDPFTNTSGLEGWAGLVGWPIADSLPTKWVNLSTTDRAQSRESPTSKDRRPNHWATSPTKPIYRLHVCEFILGQENVSNYSLISCGWWSCPFSTLPRTSSAREKNLAITHGGLLLS